MRSCRPCAPRRRTRAKIERARNTLETRIITGLEGLGGFGGVADRLNSYNHYLKTPEYLQQDIARYRAVTPATELAFVKTQLTPASRVVVHAVKGTPNLSSPPTPPAAAVGARDRARSRSMSTSRGARIRRRRRPRAPTCGCRRRSRSRSPTG